MANKLTKLITKWSVVPLANLGRNIVGKQLPTLLYVTCCVRLHTLLHVVACCCVLLGVVVQSLNPVKLLATCKQMQQAPTMLGVVASVCTQLNIVWDLSLLHPFSQACNTYATTPNNHCWPTTPNIVRCYLLRPFAHPVAYCCTKFETGQTFSFVQTGATTPLNVGSCWPTMCRPFTRGFRHKTIQTKTP